MPKELRAESRFDFRGGLNTYLSKDLLNENELIQTDDIRLDANGFITIRTSTRRMHSSALAAAPILGVTQWDGPSGSQIVAICNGDLFYRNQSSGEFAAFTQVDPGATDAFSLTELATFSTLRGATDSAPVYLYIASGGKLYEWTGTTLTRLDGASSSLGQFAPDAQLVSTYHLRLFCNSKIRPQHLVWSRIGDGRVFKGGLAADGGTAMVSAQESDPITALVPLGRSLLVSTENALARVAGYLASDIQIDQDLEGISPDVGIIGRAAFCRVDRLVAFYSKRGVYLASEGAITPISLKVRPSLEAIDKTYLDKVVLAFNQGRDEIMIFYSEVGSSGLNKAALVYNVRHQAWYGPFRYLGGWGVSSACSYERVDGTQAVISGGSDGFIRLMDEGNLQPCKDDITSSGTGGTAVLGTCILAPFFFSNPAITHSLRSIFLQAMSFTTNNEVWVGAKFQEDTTYTDQIVFSNTTYDSKSFRLDYSQQGRRLLIHMLFGASGLAPVSVQGVVAHAYVMNRLPTS
jgi:hypothetical protein